MLLVTPLVAVKRIRRIRVQVLGRDLSRQRHLSHKWIAGGGEPERARRGETGCERLTLCTLSVLCAGSRLRELCEGESLAECSRGWY